MGSEQYFKGSRGQPPFLASPRLQELEAKFKADGGLWKEFKIGDLFEISTGSLLNSRELRQGKIPRISVKSDNNGILGYYDTLDNSNARHCKNFISVNFFGNAFYHPYFASLEMKVHILKLKNYEFTKESGIFITSVINKFFANKFSYGEQLSSSKLKSENYIISLPVDKNRQIAFKFMEDYIAELEAERVRELEAYLAASKLKDYALNADEKEALKAFENSHRGGGIESSVNWHSQTLEWKEFKIGELFDIYTGKDVIIGRVKSGEIPLISHQNTNNGVVKYIEKLENRHLFDFNKTISLADRGVFCAFTQNQNFHIGTRVKALVFKQGNVSECVRLFFTTMINQLQILFSEYLTNATNKLPNLSITLPVHKNGCIAFEFMQVFIKAVQKEVIKNVVLYTDKKLAAYALAIK